MAGKRDLIGRGRAKLQPKLQMIANGSTEVNAVRAEQCSALRVTNETTLDELQRRRVADSPTTGRVIKRVPDTVSLTAITDDVEAHVFVYLIEGFADSLPMRGERARKANVVSARVPLSSLTSLTEQPAISYIEMAESLKRPFPVVTAGKVSAPSTQQRRFGNAAKHHYGANVLIGVIDVQGFDFSHSDFLDQNGHTRFVAIWDQGGDARPSPQPAGTRFGYGAEFNKAHLDAALDASPGLGVPPYEIERQSQLVEGSHGTHVASTAAGNRGICRRSPIAAVLVSLPDSDQDRRRSFSDSTRLVDAIDYLVTLAGKMGLPLSMNVSLGTNGHAHDGSAAVDRWIDSVMSIPGRAITVAAGNAGQECGETADDVGWMMGRVHTSGRVPAAGLSADIEWVVAGNGVVDISENELELWFNPQDRFAVSLRTPNGQLIGPIEPREFIENRRLADGSFISVYNELYHPANGANYMGIYLSPNLQSNPVIGVQAGGWTVRLQGR